MKPERKKFAGPGRGHIITLQGEIDCGRVPLDWALKLLELYRAGGCDTEAQAMLSDWRGLYSVELFKAWLEREEFFAEIVELGRLYAKAYWLREGRASIKSANFNVAAYQMQMFNRYGWANATKNTTTLEAGASLSGILKEIAELNRGFPIRTDDDGRKDKATAD